DSKIDDDISVYDDDFEDIEYVEASLLDLEIVSIEEENEEADLFPDDNSIPPGIENFADDPEGDIRFLEELPIDDSILSHELSDDNNPSILRPPLEPLDVESFFDLKPDVIAEEISDKLNEDSFTLS
nr:hypothetical protein [Tanacetum cinerariifolium]